MKKYFLLLTLVHFALSAQNPYWNWAKINQTEYDETIIDTKFDSKGNFYVLGRFQLNLNIDNTSVNCANGRAGYIAKYNKNGEIIWIKDINPFGKQLNLYTLHIDKNDDVIIGGSFIIGSFPFNQQYYTPITFDNNNYNLTIELIGTFSSNSLYPFIVKFDSLGQFQWVKDFNGAGEISSTTSDDLNNIYVTGNFTTSSLKIDNLEVYHSLMYPQIPDGYITKINKNGTPLVLKSFGGDIYDVPTSLEYNSNNNISIAGYFSSPIFSFDSEVINNSNNNIDIFHLEIDPDLNFVSKYSIDNSNPYESSSFTSNIFLNSNKEIIVYGHFYENNFNQLDLNLSKIGLSDMYVTKYSNGNRLWIKQIGYTNSYLFLDKITEDNANNLFIACDFSSPTITFNNTTLHNDCEFSTMIIKLDNSQNIKWIKGANGNSEGNFPKSIQCKENNILVGGFVTSNSLTFDETTLNYNTTRQRSYLAMIKDNNSIDNQISIYPNPVSSEINVLSFKQIFSKKYQIINPLGKIIKESHIDNYSNSINVNYLQSGIYFLKLEDYDAIKFIKN